jgi:hypothetical protein
LDQLYSNLEIQRQAVVIAIRRVEFTQAQLSAPLPVPVPGAPPPSFGPTAVQNLLTALSDLSGAQNNFMSVWLRYYSNRIQLVRTLGIMELDEQGRWIDRPLDEVLAGLLADGYCAPIELPPPITSEYWQLTEPIPARNVQMQPAPGHEPVEQPIRPAPEQGQFEHLPSVDPALQLLPTGSATTNAGLRPITERALRLNLRRLPSAVIEQRPFE